MPVLLFIDTSATVATVGISCKGEIAGQAHHREAKEHASEINVLIRQVLNASGKSLREIDAICVCAGPGSYTGLRVAMSTAKGIAFALNKPLMLFDRLTLIALSVDDKDPDGHAVVLKARKEEYFCRVFDGAGLPVSPPAHLYEATLKEQVGQLPVITDDPLLPLPNHQILLPPGFEIDLAQWSRIAEWRWKQSGFDDLAYSEPFYLKAAYTTTPTKNIL